MNKTHPFLHFDSDNNYYYHIGMILFPLIFYGFYKNGILPFLNQDANLYQMLKPLLFPFIGFAIGLLVDYMIWWQNSEKVIWTSSPFYGTLITMTLPLTSNLFLVGILLFLFLFFFRKLEKTKYAMNGLFGTKFLFVILLTFLAKVPFQNPTESTNLVIYSTLDIFFGRNLGGISTTSIFLMLLAYAYLWFYYYYKKSIPIYIIITFIILSLIFELILPTGNLLTFLLNPSLIFASVFFAPEVQASPYTEFGQRIYGVGCGLLSFLCIKFVNTLEGVYIALAIMGLFVPILDKLSYLYEKKNKKFCRNAFIQKRNLGEKKNPIEKKNTSNEKMKQK